MGRHEAPTADQIRAARESGRRVEQVIAGARAGHAVAKVEGNPATATGTDRTTT